jgi:hypothetical protein
VLVDPPYEINFVKQSARAGLAKLFHLTVKPGGTAVIFMHWTQIEGWKQVFLNQAKTTGNWHIENVIPIHKDEEFAFRSPIVGHKKMTERVMIIHRKDATAMNKLARTGQKNPCIEELEQLFGEAHAGLWKFDFVTGAMPPDRKWYVK